jgi:hypothetical protein
VSPCKKQRDIALVASELQVALKRETRNFIVIGDLLIEAKEKLDHGEWLPWIEVNFGSSDQTAERYMNAARLAAKFPTVRNLKLRPTVLYLLGGKLNNPDELFSPKAVEAILKAAETEWVNADRACDIARRARPPDIEKQEEKQRAERRALAAEAAAIPDGPPPELPPPEEAAAPDVALQQFDRAVTMLAQVYTKPLATFAATTHEPSRIDAVVDFLRAVVERTRECRGVTTAPKVPQ